jgi:hypothetical protein
MDIPAYRSGASSLPEKRRVAGRLFAMSRTTAVRLLKLFPPHVLFSY